MREKLRDMDWLMTCTKANVDYLQELAEDPSKVHLLYHGLDFSRFPEKRGFESIQTLKCPR